ncbi:MAG: TonB-dependent receptor, partial [Terriglobia bacterium]
MKHICRLSLLLLAAISLVAQNDRGTITGTVSDPGGGVIPNASVVAKNVETGASSQTVTTGTGNFTLSSLPAGPYEVSVEAPGFSKYVQTGILVQVAITARLDIVLKIGSTSETISVNAEATMLATESAEASTNVTGDRINSLPLNFGGGAGAIGAIRNQMAFVILSPGVAGSGTGARINGFSGNSFRVMIDGQDSTSGNTQSRVDETAASVEAIEEFTLQTSNFSAEYGQALGGIFNFTIRSGTNGYHGSLFEYLTNEDLNATQPLATTHVRPVSRKNDFGGTIGGPVRIPKIYNGKDKTFFFFNWEYFRNKTASTGVFQTVPTTAYRNGDFSAALTNRVLGTDGLGRPIMENAIYDPNTNRTINGVVYRDVFPGNIIPSSRFDPVAVAVQKFIPSPINNSLSNNWQQNGVYVKSNSAPAFKIDHAIDQNDKLSFYYGYLTTVQKSSFDSLPTPITATRFQEIYSHTTRLNYDRTFSPTVLFHAGAGFIRYINPDSASPEVLNFDAVKDIGFKGSATTPGGFPRIAGLSSGASSSFGGMSLGMGPVNANLYFNDKWTSVASLTWIRGNHSFKLGGEMRVDIFTDRNSRGAQGVLNFAASETGLPATQGLTLPGGTSVGLNYASFLLGLVDNASVNAVQDPQWRKTSWGAYIQDTWKVTRKLTLDYGLRWDYEAPGHEIWNRVGTIGFSTPNPAAGGLPGAMIYAGYGPGRCNCDLSPRYPYAIGPRLGVAYQINPKTVFRGGWGISYGNLSGLGYITNSVWNGVGFNSISWNAPGAGDPAAILRNGLSYNVADLYKATLDPGALPLPGQNNAPQVIIDPSWGRPPRINQWSVGIQREVSRNLSVEVAYVANRGVWLN